jgi:hypothetical protein
LACRCWASPFREIGRAHSRFSNTALTLFEATALLVTLLLLLAPRFRRLSVHNGVLIGVAAGVLVGVADAAIEALLGFGHSRVGSVLVSRCCAQTLTVVSADDSFHRGGAFRMAIAPATKRMPGGGWC